MDLRIRKQNTIIIIIKYKKSLTIKTLRKNILLPPFPDSALLSSPIDSSPPILPSQQVTLSSFIKDTISAGGWWVHAQPFLPIGLPSFWFYRVCLPRATGHICSHGTAPPLILVFLLLFLTLLPFLLCRCCILCAFPNVLSQRHDKLLGLQWFRCEAGWKSLYPAQGNPCPLPQRPPQTLSVFPIQKETYPEKINWKESLSVPKFV